MPETNTNRRHERVPVKLRLTAKGEDLKADIWFYTADLSVSGVYLVSDFLLEKGTPIELEFALPNGRRVLRLSARIVWVNLGLSPAGSEKPSGMGVEFAPGREDREEIERFLGGLKKKND